MPRPKPIDVPGLPAGKTGDDISHARHSTCKVLPCRWCITYGKTLAEAQLMATDVIGAYVASLRKHRELVPSDEKSFIGSVELGELKGRRVVAYA